MKIMSGDGFMENNEQVSQQPEQPSPAQPEINDPPFAIKALILGCVLGVLILAVTIVVPAMSKGSKGAASIIEEGETGGYRDFFSR